MSSTVSYGGTTIATVTNQTRTLNTAGKWMTSNVVITDTTEGGGGGGGVQTTIIVPEQTVTASGEDTQLTSNGNLVVGDSYIVTLDGTVMAGTGVSRWGGVQILANTNIYAAYYNNVMYLEIEDSSLYGSHTIKVERIDSWSGGSATLITKNITANGTYSASDDSADGYSSVTVNVPSGGASKNVQTAQTTGRRNNTALGSVASLTCSTAGTYDVYWSCARSSTSGTWGSQLYINGTAYGTENTTFSNNVQNNHLTGVTIPANATVAVYGRSRSGYYIYVPQLTIEQTS